MKRLSLVLVAALLALAGSALTPVTHVLADGCGVAGDVDDIPYTDSDGYVKTSGFVVGGDGNLHELNMDLQTYRLQSGGVCYRGAYASSWFTNHEYAWHNPELNAWTQYGGTLRGPWRFFHGQFWDWGNYVWTRWDNGLGYPTCSTCSQLGPWAGKSANVTLPNGAYVTMDFGNVQNVPTDRKFNNDGMIINDCNPTCHFSIISPTGGWSVSIWQ